MKQGVSLNATILLSQAFSLGLLSVTEGCFVFSWMVRVVLQCMAMSGLSPGCSSGMT